MPRRAPSLVLDYKGFTDLVYIPAFNARTSCDTEFPTIHTYYLDTSTIHSCGAVYVGRTVRGGRARGAISDSVTLALSPDCLSKTKTDMRAILWENLIFPACLVDNIRPFAASHGSVVTGQRGNTLFRIKKHRQPRMDRIQYKRW